MKDKEYAIGVFRGDLYDFRQHWMSNRSQPCSGEGCEACSKGIKSAFRFRVNFITKDEKGQPIAKIVDQSYSVYEQLRALHESDYPLPSTIVKITRYGSGAQDTSYMIIPMPNYKVTPAMEASFKNVQLHDLNPALASKDDQPPADNPPPPNDEDLPW